jgi:hypothetical protein
MDVMRVDTQGGHHRFAVRDPSLPFELSAQGKNHVFGSLWAKERGGRRQGTDLRMGRSCACAMLVHIHTRVDKGRRGGGCYGPLNLILSCNVSQQRMLLDIEETDRLERRRLVASQVLQ